nr:hypothetical protein HmN_000274500 [Hymenolepis microstoma]
MPEINAVKTSAFTGTTSQQIDAITERLAKLEQLVIAISCRGSRRPMAPKRQRQEISTRLQLPQYWQCYL